MRLTLSICLIGFALGIGGCVAAVIDTEDMLAQAGFRKLAPDTEPWAEQSVAPHRLTRREAETKTYYVYADPDNCKCLFVGDDDAYDKYQVLARERQDAMAADAAREAQHWGRP